MKVWVAAIEHQYGIDPIVGRTEKAVWDEIMEYVREWWPQEWPEEEAVWEEVQESVLKWQPQEEWPEEVFGAGYYFERIHDEWLWGPVEKEVLG